MDILLNPATEDRLNKLYLSPPQAILIAGQEGIGKTYLAENIITKILDINDYKDYVYNLKIEPSKSKGGIEAIREVYSFLSLKITSDKPLNRSVFIEHAEYMSLPAQNALLKILEEPPTGSLFILSVSSPQAILPTIRSRVELLQVIRPTEAALKEYFKDQSVDIVSQAYLISDGLPGKMHSILTNPDSNLLKAREMARNILSATATEKLGLVDILAKDKELSSNTLRIMQQMANSRLSVKNDVATKKWEKVLNNCTYSLELLKSNVNAKLALMHLMLNL